METPLFSQGKIKIFGKYEKGYEAVKDGFVQNFVSGQELNASICVYVKEKCVVDMYGTSIDDISYNATRIQVFYFLASFNSYYIPNRIIHIYFNFNDNNFYPKFIPCECKFYIEQKQWLKTLFLCDFA